MRLKLFGRILESITILLLAALTAVTFLQVVTRYILEYSFSWTEEVARYLLIWSTLIAAVLCVRDETHIDIDFLYSKTSPRMQTLLGVVGNVVFLVFCTFLVWQGTDILQVIRFQRAAAVPISMVWIYIAGPVSALLMMIYLTDRIISLIKGRPLADSNSLQADGKEDI